MTKAFRTSLAIGFFVALCFTLLPVGQANDSGKGARVVTFSRDVAPIIYKNCAECHRPGELAPMSLLTFKEARPWARSIKEKVVTRQMPPWHADPAFGHFSNNVRLSQQEVDTITAWVDQGAKEGNPKDLPRLPEFTTGWKIGKPDVVLTMPEEYTVEASGPDEYINFFIPTNFKEDTWVQAAEINPGNKRVVHHVIGFVQPPQMQRRTNATPNPQSIFHKEGTLIRARMDAPVHDDGCAAPNGGFARGSGQEGLGLPLCFYTPGKDVDIWPEGTAKLIPAGSNIVIQMHYSKVTGKVEKDRSSIGFIVAKEPPEKMLMSFGVVNHYFKIPPGADNHEVKGCYTFGRDTELLTYLPHMHVRGKSMKYEVIYPDGRRETLLNVPRYDFNWQTMYRLEKPVVIPKGTRMIVTAHFDNSEKNKHNPDPTKFVRFGDPTYDEMMIGYFDFVTPTPNRPAVKVDPIIYDAYVGDYQVMPGAAVKITREGNKLMAGATGMPSFEIFPETETKFFFKVVDAQVTFVKNDKGDVTELVFEQNGRTIRARKIIKDGPSGTDK